MRNVKSVPYAVWSLNRRLSNGRWLFFSIALALSAPSLSNAQSNNLALIRVACEGTSNGAEISINGVFKGDCPLDVSAAPGTVKLRAFKKLDENRESVFETEFRIAGGVVKRVDVELSPPRLNAAAFQRAEEARIRLEAEQRAQKEAADLAEANELARLSMQANSGDADAMLALAEKQKAGGNSASASTWFAKAAAAGSPYAQFILSDFYGRNANHESVKALVKILKRPTPSARSISVVGMEAVKQFVARDPFFNTTGAGSTNYRIFPSDGVTSERTCTANGKVYEIQGKINIKNANFGSSDYFVTAASVLGGLLPLNWKAEARNLFIIKSVEAEHSVVQIDKVWGQPFPLDPNERFGISFALRDFQFGSEETASYLMMCGLDETRRLTSLDRHKILICSVSKANKILGIFESYLNTDTGCVRRGFKVEEPNIAY